MLSALIPIMMAARLSPLAIPDLVGLYTDADTKATRSGSDVTAWLPSNVGAPTLTPTGTAPTYSATGFASRPAVLFNGSGLSASLSLSGDRTIFVVFQTGPTGSQTVASMGGLVLQYNAAVGYRASTPDAESNSGDTTAAVPIIQTGVSGSTVVERHIRAGSLYGGSVDPTAGAGGSNLVLGEGGSAGIIGGAVAAAAFYSRALSTAEIELLETWAHRKYGLPIP